MTENSWKNGFLLWNFHKLGKKDLQEKIMMDTIHSQKMLEF